MADTIRQHKNLIVPGSAGRPMATDVFFIENGRPKPVVLYVHGFNGFKDWGGFDLIAQRFAEGGFVFVKFNLSHNGTTPESPETFTDPDAYGQDNYSIQLADIGLMMDWLCDGGQRFSTEMDTGRLGLLGHSRGGGNVLLKAEVDSRVKAVATWASVSEAKTPWGSWPAARLAAWKESGVEYTTNSRTGQQLPHGYQLLEDYEANRTRFDIGAAVQRLRQPLLLIHGRADSSVPVEKALLLQSLKPDAELLLIDSDHVFGRKHPWTEDRLPAATLEAVDRTLAFFGKVL